MAPEAKISYPEGVEIRTLNEALKPLGAKVLEDDHQDSLEQAIAEYQKGVRTPEFWTNYWRVKLQIDAGKAGLEIKITVPDCDWTKEEIRRPMKDIERNDVPGIMVPVIDAITLPVLGRIYSLGNPTVQKDTPVKDTHDTRGWVKVYAPIDAPNLNTPQSRAEEFARQQGYLGQRLKTYILVAQAIKDLTGRYLDEGFSWSWLTGSRARGEVVCACFGSDGRLGAFWRLDPEIPFQVGGWRFEEVKRV